MPYTPLTPNLAVDLETGSVQAPDGSESVLVALALEGRIGFTDVDAFIDTVVMRDVDMAARLLEVVAADPEVGRTVPTQPKVTPQMRAYEPACAVRHNISITGYNLSCTVAALIDSAGPPSPQMQAKLLEANTNLFSVLGDLTIMLSE